MPYKVILKRLELDSLNDKLGGKRFRSILRQTCRIPKNLVTPLLNEMIKCGWIEMNSFNEVTIIKKVNVDLIPIHPSRYNNRVGT